MKATEMILQVLQAIPESEKRVSRTTLLQMFWEEIQLISGRYPFVTTIDFTPAAADTKEIDLDDIIEELSVGASDLVDFKVEEVLVDGLTIDEIDRATIEEAIHGT